MSQSHLRPLLWIIGIFISLMLGGGGIYEVVSHNKAAAAEKEKAAAPRPVPVLLAPAEQKDVPIWLEGLGSVAAFQQVSVHAQVDGKLDKVLFTEGQAVKKGQLLAQIDPRPFLVQLHNAEGSLDRDRATQKNAQVNLDRYGKLRTEQLVPQQQVDDQKALVDQALGSMKIDEASIESAKLNLDYAQVRSPIDGVVGVRLIDQGNLIHAADSTAVLVVITQLDPAAVFLTVPQDELPRIALAMKRGDVVAEAWSRDGSQKLATGKLAVIDNQINQATATLKLKALFANPDRLLWPNQFVKARILLDTRKGALVVPSSAVQRGPKGTFVYVADASNVAQPHDVVVALVTGDVTVLDSGVNSGDQVVIEGANQLRPGASVAPRGKDGTVKDGGKTGGVKEAGAAPDGKKGKHDAAKGESK